MTRTRKNIDNNDSRYYYRCRRPVTLHFLGVQGPHHVITIDGVGTFPLDRGQKDPHSIVYCGQTWCHVHQPNMDGEILVLPKPA